MRSKLLCFLPVLLAVPALSQPAITNITNNYSYIPPGFTSSGIAQGSIFAIFGTNLATSTSKLQSVPLQTTVDGVSVTVTVNGVTTRPLIYYVSPVQIAAVLPSTTPVGTAAVKVANGAQTSAAFTMEVVKATFGILTMTGSGWGQAAAYDSRWGLLSAYNAVAAGEYITIWGSGAGPIAGDETLVPVPADLTSSPMTVEIGGKPATVLYHGRSSAPGLDQINVVIPQGVYGCQTNVVVKTGGFSSNSTTIPVALTGHDCTDTSAYPRMTNPASSSGSIFVGHSESSSMSHGTSVPAGRTITEDFSASFQKYGPREALISALGWKRAAYRRRLLSLRFGLAADRRGFRKPG